jgi:hypothetical protein
VVSSLQVQVKYAKRNFALLQDGNIGTLPVTAQ